MAARTDIQDATGRLQYLPGKGQLHAWGSGVPTDGVQGFAPSCIYQNVDGTAGSTFYVNIGTFLSSNWFNLC